MPEAERSDAPGQSAVAEQPSPETEIRDLDAPEVVAEEEQPEGSEEGEAEQEAAPEEPVDDGLDDLDFGFKKFRVAKDLKSMVEGMRTDYTQKTQAIAEERRALLAQAEQQAAATQARIAKAGQLANAEAMIRRYQTEIDWQALEAENPPLAQTRMRELQQWQFTRDDLSREVAGLQAQEAQARQEMALKERNDLVLRIQQAAATYRNDIPTWTDDLPKVVQYGLQNGWTHAELGMDPTRAHEAVLADPRIGKLLHKAWQADQLLQKQQAAAKQRTQQPKAPPAAVQPLQTVTPKSAGPTGRKSLEDLAKGDDMKAFAEGYEKTYGKQRARR